MTVLTRSRIATLAVALLAPLAVALACSPEPVSGGDRDDDDDGQGGTSNSCPVGQELCATGCATLATDSQNCGQCGRACLPGQACSGSMCQCTPPLQQCATGCANTASDPNNCGVCGTICPATAPFCSSGACSASCGAGLTPCGNACVDVASDLLNCGSCNVQCAAGQSCSGGLCQCPPGQVPCAGGCAATCGSGGMSGTGAGGMAGSGVGGQGGTSGGGAGGASAGSAGAGGSGGTPPVMKLCATKVTVTSPTLTDFESYDGMVPAYSMMEGQESWGFAIGDPAAPAYAGLYALSDMTGTYTLAMAAGANGSNWAARADNTLASDWGGGVGMWMGCINASAYTGLSFWARGASPNGMMSVAIAMEDATAPDAANPAGGGTCDPAPAEGCASPSAAVAITADWTEYSLPWAMFTPGVGAAGAAVAANGDEITGLVFQAQMNYVPNPADDGGTYIPEPGAYEIAVDSIVFTQ